MEKCKLCSKNAKSVYHHGKCPKGDRLKPFEYLHIKKLQGIFESGQLYFEGAVDPAKEGEDV